MACEKVLHSLTKGDCSFVLFLIYLLLFWLLFTGKKQNRTKNKKAERNDLRHEAFSQCYYHCLFFVSCNCRGGEKDERQRSFVLLSFTTTVLSIAFCLHVVITGCVTA